jgi:hypothetical protein
MEKDSALSDLYHGHPQILHYRWGLKETITRLIRGVTAHIMKNKIYNLPGMYFGKVVHFKWSHCKSQNEAREFFNSLLKEFENLHPATIKKMRECVSCSYESTFPQDKQSFSLENVDNNTPTVKKRWANL